MKQQVRRELAPGQFAEELVRGFFDICRCGEDSLSDLVRGDLAEVQVRGQARNTLDIGPVPGFRVAFEPARDELLQGPGRARFTRPPGVPR